MNPKNELEFDDSYVQFERELVKFLQERGKQLEYLSVKLDRNLPEIVDVITINCDNLLYLLFDIAFDPIEDLPSVDQWRNLAQLTSLQKLTVLMSSGKVSESYLMAKQALCDIREQLRVEGGFVCDVLFEDNVV